MRQFVAVDAAFSKTNFEYVLVLATGLDAEGRIVILAWGLLPRETTESWRWFLESLKVALVSLDRKDCVVISDRQKVSALHLTAICESLQLRCI